MNVGEHEKKKNDNTHVLLFSNKHPYLYNQSSSYLGLFIYSVNGLTCQIEKEEFSDKKWWFRVFYYHFIPERGRNSWKRNHVVRFARDWRWEFFFCFFFFFLNYKCVEFVPTKGTRPSWSYSTSSSSPVHGLIPGCTIGPKLHLWCWAQNSRNHTFLQLTIFPSCRGCGTFLSVWPLHSLPSRGRRFR